MRALLTVAGWIDRINDKFGWVAAWAVFLSCFISAGNALVRYLANYSSNAWLEIQWYLFAACVMLGTSQVLRLNEHVRVDVFYGRLSGKHKVVIDLLGLVLFLLPVMALMLYLSWPLFWRTYTSGEMSGNVGGLIRWPAMLMLPLGFGLLILQAVAEVIKRIAWLTHGHELSLHYERPLQ